MINNKQLDNNRIRSSSHSIIKTRSCQPSRPGNGNKLKIAKLTEITPQIRKKLMKPLFLRTAVVS